MSGNQSWPHSDTAGGGATNFGNNPPSSNPPVGQDEQNWNRGGNTPQNNPSNWPQLGIEQQQQKQAKEQHEQLTNMMSRVQIQSNPTPQSEDTSWANAKPDGEPQYHGWGKPDPNSATGWGAPTATGWGSSQPQPSVDNGTAVWGNSKTVQDQGSGWGGHQVGNSLTNASNPPISSAQTTDTPTVQPQQASQDATSNVVTTNVDSTASSVATSTAAKKSIATTDEKLPVVTTSNEPLAPVSVANPPDNPPTSVPPPPTEPADPVQQYVNSHEGWGKTPIQQNGSWDHVEDAFKQPHIPRGGPGRYEHISNGTEAWGKPSTGQMPPTGGNWGEPKKHPNNQYHGPNYQGPNNNNWGVNQPGYGPSQYGGSWNDQRPNQPNNDRWGGDQQGHQGGWGGPSTVNQSKGSWGNHMNDNNRNWNMGRGNQNSYNPSGSNNWDNQPPMQDWNRLNEMGMNQRRPVDDGTRLWGDPNSYDNVQLWDNRRGPNMDMNAPNNNGKGWGGAGGMPPNNQGKGWGDGPSRPVVDNGTQVWRKPNQPQSLDKGSDWMKHNQDNQVWNSKPSNGGWGQSNDYNDGTSGWGQQKGYQNKGPMDYNNMRGGMNRPNHQQQQPPPIAPLPPSPQLNQQFQQAVMQGLIPPAALHPNLMVDARHMQSLVQLLQKQNELNQFQNRMGKGLRNQDDVMRYQRIQNQFDLARNQVLQSTQSFNNKPNVNKNMDISSMRQQQLPNMGNAVPNLGQSGAGNAGWKQPKDNKMYGAGNDANSRMNPNNHYSGYMMPQDQQQMGQDPKMMENSLVGKSDFNNMDGNHTSKEMTNNNNSPLADIGPPEFTPGVPWPGLRPIDPENDPNITPGSVSKQISVVNKVSDTDQLLKRDRGGALSDSSGNGTNGNAVNGILNENSEVFSQSNNQQQDRYSNHHHQQQGCWLVLTNFTPGVDVEAVRELCARHGTVMTFQAHNPIENMALVRYSNQEEAKAAKAALHIKRVGTTMLLASVSTDQEVENFHSASNGSALYPSSAGGAAPNANSRFTMSTSGGGASNGSSGNFISHQQQQQANHHQQQQQRNPMQGRMMSPVNHQQPNNYVWSTQPSQAWAGAGGGAAPHQQAWSAGGSGNASQNLIDDNMHSYLPENLLVNEM